MGNKAQGVFSEEIYEQKQFFFFFFGFLIFFLSSLNLCGAVIGLHRALVCMFYFFSEMKGMKGPF